MKFRKVIFWAHLISGVAAGFVVLFLSITGVLLTYELQIIKALEKPAISYSEQNTEVETKALSPDELLTIASSLTNGKATALTFDQNKNVPVAVQTGRKQHSLLNPVTGESIENATKPRKFFNTVTALHRWFALEGESRNLGKNITGASNLVFLFLLMSGIYLWLPKVWRWPLLKTRVLFSRNLPTSKARDYNWHHVFSFWTLIPLFFIITTGVVFSYKWANNLVFVSFGEEAPKRGGPPAVRSNVGPGTDFDPNSALSYAALLEVAKEYRPGWQRITLETPKSGSPFTNFKVDFGTGKQPQKAFTLQIHRGTGEIRNIQRFSDRTPAQQTRVIIRFLHTGEVLGWFGQTLAGLSSIAACFLVYTGFALAYRRLLQPYLKRRLS